MKILLAVLLFLLSFTAAMAKVNVNTATVEDLTTVKGIGQKTAESIVEYRAVNGPFSSINDLVNVKGIGATSLKRFADALEVSPIAPSDPLAPTAPVVSQ